MKLFCFPRSGNSREVKLVLAEKGVAYESINTHAEDFNQSDAEFRKASPVGEVPALIDDSSYLCDALDINLYLENKYTQKPLLPKEKNKQNEIVAWIKDYDKRLTIKIGLYIVECLLKPKERQSEETKKTLLAGIQKGLKDADTFLGNKDFFFGEYSLADIALTPHVAALPRVNLGLTDEHPNLKRWLEKVKSRPNFTASMN